MKMFFDVVLFIVSLAINSLLLGLVVTGGTAMAFQLIRNSFPRLRYTLAVAAFVIAAFVPVAVTLARTHEPQSPPIGSAYTEEPHSRIVSSGDTSATDWPSNSTGQDQTLVSSRTNLLNDLALYVGSSWLGKLFSGIWIFVSLHLLLQEIAGYRQLRNERKTWRLANAAQRQSFFCPDNVTLYFAEEGFFTTGFLSSAIVLPHHFPDNLSSLSIRGIVLHEIAHAKWRDACANSLVRIVHALFWINPSLWFLNRIIRAEREAAADRSALAALFNSEGAAEANTDYATAIVSVAKLSAAGSLPAKRLLAAMHFGDSIKLENRIQRILNGGSQPKWFRLSLGFAVFLTSVLTLTIIPVASIPLTRAQAEISPVAYGDMEELNVADAIRPVSRHSLQWTNYLSKRNDAEQASVNAVMGDKKTSDQKLQTNTVALNPNLTLVYRRDSAEPVLRTVNLNLPREVHLSVPRNIPRDAHLDLPREIVLDIHLDMPSDDPVKLVNRSVVRPVYKLSTEGNEFPRCPTRFEINNGNCRRAR